MADNATPPSVNPADLDSLGGTFNTILRKFLQNVDDMLPAKVIAYDRVKNVATVQPLIMVTATDQTKTSRPQYAQIPVFSYGGGGICINFPLQPNDVGWIHANDRDISLYIQGLAETNANTKRFHSFRDGIFFPDVLRSYTIDEEDENAAVFQLLANTSKVSINRDGKVIVRAGDTKMTMLADGTLTVVYDTATLTGTLTTINSEVIINGDTTITGDTTISGALDLTGDATISGDVNITGDVHNNGVEIGSIHVHPIPSGGVTDVPE